MKNPKVTVLMPVYNGEKYLGEAIDSVLCQTFTDFELLIIDDCSTDDTPKILAEYRDPRIRILRNAENLKLVRTLNKGLLTARGEYIARLDADDVALPDRLSKQTAVLDEHPEVVVVSCRVEAIDGDGETLWSQSVADLTSEMMFYTKIFQNFMGHSSIMMRKDSVMKMGGYDESMAMCEDWDLWSRVSRMSPIIVQPEILCKWRDTEASVQRQYPAEQRDYTALIFKKNISELSDGTLDPEKLMCFHHNRYPEREHAPITIDALLELNKLHNMMISDCPKYLDKATLAAYCQRQFTNAVRTAYHDGGVLILVRLACHLGLAMGALGCLIIKMKRLLRCQE